MRPLLALLLLCALPACTLGSRGAVSGLPELATRTAEPTAVPVEETVAEPAPSAVPGGDALLRISDHPGVPDGEAVGVDIGAGDRAFLVSVQGATPDGLVGIRSVTDPTGTIGYRANLRGGFVLIDDLDVRVVADAGAVGFYVAAPAGGELLPGRWEIIVAANDASATVRVAVTGGDPASPRHLDVVVWATANVDAHAVASAWRAAATSVLAPHGLSIGRLDVIDAGAAGQAHRVLGVDGLAGDAHEACAAAHAAIAPPPRTAVVVLAERIGEGVLTAAADAAAPAAAMAYRQPDGDISGFTVSTPGTPVIGPASHACVAVAKGEDPAAGGLTALHEILHLAGLTQHTTEEDGRRFDRIADTPECPAALADADLDRRVTAAECADRGADNLMFWAQGGMSISAEQAWRVRWHPLLVQDVSSG